MTCRPAGRQATRGATMARRLPPLDLPGTLPCHGCGHDRDGHNPMIVRGACRQPGCGCGCFDPACVCGHTLADHEWGTPPRPYACAACACRTFATGAGIVELTLF